jgi:iron complex outermembrane recepter protein
VQAQGLSPVQVIEAAPLPGLGIAVQEYPGNVQSIPPGPLQNSPGQPINDTLNLHLPSVHITDTQNNPLQPDLFFRGFTASPLLGTPQGLSVYMDSKRINEPFGETVNWDLIPRNAIARVQVMPGSNPVYGLNTLGGAIVFRTKDGLSAQGSSATLGAGSFGRQAFEFESGGGTRAFNHFFAGNVWREDGWRDFSSSKLAQGFGKLNWQQGSTSHTVTMVLAESRLRGNGFLPLDMVQQRRSQVYTQTDSTKNTTASIGWQGRWLPAQGTMLVADVSYRDSRTRQTNPDVNQIFDARFGIQPYEEQPTFANSGIASRNLGILDQNRLNASLQWVQQWNPKHETTFGAGYDLGRIQYNRTYEIGAFDSQRGFASEGNLPTEIVNITGRTQTWSAYALHFWRPDKQWTVSAAARFNSARVQTSDLLSPAIPSNTGGFISLANDYTYNKLNPSLGVTYHPSPTLSAYASVSQSTRTPSPIELACADRFNPCLLPTAMAADPYLKQVVTHTVEGGLRGTASGVRWNLGLFNAVNRDDILFVSANNNSLAYFDNVGRTQRRGIEMGLGQQHTGWGWQVAYSLIDARFGDDFLVVSPNNSTRNTTPAATSPEEDEIAVKKGNRLPGVPRHQLKILLNYKPASAITLGSEIVAFSSQFVRGNENNAHQAGTFTDQAGNTRTFDGPGQLPGYAVVNLRSQWQINRKLELLARVTNVFDKRFFTGGVLGESAFAGGSLTLDPDQWAKTTFVSPGAPRQWWVGLRYKF